MISTLMVPTQYHDDTTVTQNHNTTLKIMTQWHNTTAATTTQYYNTHNNTISRL